MGWLTPKQNVSPPARLSPTHPRQRPPTHARLPAMSDDEMEGARRGGGHGAETPDRPTRPPHRRRPPPPPPPSPPDYGFEYSEDELGQDGDDADVENQYYNSKGECEKRGWGTPTRPAPAALPCTARRLAEGMR
jgi:hypothetical protein